MIPVKRHVHIWQPPRKLSWYFCKMSPLSPTPHTPTTHTHNDVNKWKHFPRYWPFMRGIHRSPVDFPHKGQWVALWFIFDLCLNKRLSKQSRRRWFETQSRLLCMYHCNNTQSHHHPILPISPEWVTIRTASLYWFQTMLQCRWICSVCPYPVLYLNCTETCIIIS